LILVGMMLALGIAGLALGRAAAKPVLYGYDVVEYFHLDPSAAGVLGSDKYQANLTVTDESTNSTSKMLTSNYTFYFKNEENKKAFQADPWSVSSYL